MSNWCENELTIEGKKQDMERFKDTAKDEEGNLIIGFGLTNGLRRMKFYMKVLKK